MVEAALIDSAIIIDYQRRFQPAITYMDEMQEDGLARCSVVTYAELLVGCRNKKEQRIVERLLSKFTIEPITIEDSLNALELLKRHQLSGRIGFMDALIAATALRLYLPVATRNVKHFRRVEGLQIVIPY